ncbi:chromosome segregation protein SMC [Pigmentiphaga sp.]|uniref:chromosome segregation protein SMC n=1 Tax=Pigmentiphaga sp. TaxID=1977564 RepID=UPI0025F5D848|nr:chromosome segregation protein SMC [Pigmentiphaga sp.]MBX6317046.1 chromosome segregation protein SMC [Pigmentiphaga sp.]
MRLTQIKLAGFKSFVDPTSIHVPSQLVGVVGPNGCGKSNIIDAVRWVLGESKASELRGESMQDVIFNGSVNRKPAARASVELVFDNSEGRAAGQWSQYSEIAVKRVLTRDGTSSYFINNQQVRRRDIHDIFLGTGLGARGYAIIGQGMISRIIEARPEELRVFLEEAAGVSRYKERRRETENRLSDTRENMTRVEDILRELATQLEKLEAQAEVAQRYKSLQAESEQKQRFLWLLKKREADADRAQYALAIEQAQADLEGATANLRKLEAELEGTRQAHYAASDAVHAAQGSLYEANAEVSRLEAEIKYVVEARNRMQAQLAQLQQQIAQWSEQHETGGEQLAQAEEDLAVGEARAEEARVVAEEAQAQLPDIEAKVRDAAAGLSELRSALSLVEQNLALTAQEQREADRQLQALAQRRERLEAEERNLQRPDPARLEQLTGDLADTEQRVAQAQQELSALEEQLPVVDAARRQAQETAQKEAAAVSQIEARLSALTRLQQDVQKQGALHPWLEKHELTQLGRLWQKLHIEQGWETALEAVLRERLGALEVSNLDWAKAFFNDAPPARLAFYQLPPASAPAAAPAALTSLASLLRISDPGLRALMNDWLRDVYVATDASQALAGRAQLPEGGYFVVKEGHLVGRNCVRFYAPDSEQAGMLARQQEIENLQRQVKAQQLIADEARSAAARAEAAYQQVAQALPASRQRLAEVTQRLHAIQLEHTRLAQQAAQMEERAARIQEERAELEAQEEEIRIRKEEAEARFETLDAELGEKQSAFEEAQMAQEQRELEVQRARERLRELERAAQEASFAERGLRARIDELRRNMQLASEQSQRAAAEAERVQQELQVLDDAAAQAGLQAALELRSEREKVLNLARIEMDTLAAQLREADERRMTLERSLEPLRSRITELQLKEQAARLAQEQYAEQLAGEELDLAALGEQLDALPKEWQRPSWLQSELQRLSREIDALGAVNLAALDELNAARERKTYLDSQHADLQAAIDTLEDAIRKIDRETRQLLQETFDTVNRHFGELFPSLFGGGEAKLVMTGEEILDAGVQVMAQPPGKRNSTIHLLSGGEKALTATALVFAMFKLNPAPFCLLDEVDAPLDDANTERYANLVRRMSEQTQFLFISHNKIAMEMAHQLVGVTMQEQGVSRIVAVDIDSAMQLAAEAA